MIQLLSTSSENTSSNTDSFCNISTSSLDNNLYHDWSCFKPSDLFALKNSEISTGSIAKINDLKHRIFEDLNNLSIRRSNPFLFWVSIFKSDKTNASWKILEIKHPHQQTLFTAYLDINSASKFVANTESSLKNTCDEIYNLAIFLADQTRRKKVHTNPNKDLSTYPVQEISVEIQNIVSYIFKNKIPSKETQKLLSGIFRHMVNEDATILAQESKKLEIKQIKTLSK